MLFHASSWKSHLCELNGTQWVKMYMLPGGQGQVESQFFFVFFWNDSIRF